jgi:O-antigen/teichoic acid export membrane protein
MKERVIQRVSTLMRMDARYFLRGGFWLSAGQMFSSTATFLLALAFANLVLPETYGTYKYVLSVTGILTVLTLRGMDSAVLQSVTRDIEGVLFPALKTKIKWGSLSALAGISASIYYYFAGNNTLAFSFLIASVFLPFLDSFALYSSFLNGKKLFRRAVFYKTSAQIGSAVLMVVSLFFTDNLFLILLTYFASWTSFNLLFFILTIRKYPPNTKYDADIIPYGKHASTVNILDALITSIDGLLIFHYLGPINLAIYSFALAPISQVRSLFSNIPTLAVPKLSNRSASAITLVLKKRMPLLFIVGVSFSLLYILIAPYLFETFFPKYIDSVFPSQLFSISIALSLPQTVFGAAILSKITLIPKRMLYLSNIPGIIFIVSLLTLIGTYGINGVIFSRLLSLTSGYLINLAMWRKIHDVESKNISAIK